MNKNEHLIAEVDASMAIEGMSLTKSDKERMLRYLKNPESFGRIMTELLNKHKSVCRRNAG